MIRIVMRGVVAMIFALAMASSDLHAALIIFSDKDPDPTKAIVSGLPPGVDLGIVPGGENLLLNLSNSLAQPATKDQTQSFVLYDQGTKDISDYLTLQVVRASTIFKIKLFSDLETPLQPPANIVGSATEIVTGDGNTIPLNLFTLPLPTYPLTIEVRSDANVPEPPSLILLASLVPLAAGAHWLRRRTTARP
jgi:hypothetical protein